MTIHLLNLPAQDTVWFIEDWSSYTVIAHLLVLLKRYIKSLRLLWKI